MDSSTALLVVDAQYGFMPGGNLPVADGAAVVPVINRIAPRFANGILTQDWHPRMHVSFAANHPGRKPYETITLRPWCTDFVAGALARAMPNCMLIRTYRRRN